jgi:hypothetical protein
MASSVFYFGEIGVNDYIFALFSNRTSELAVSLVPDIVAVTRSALTVTTDLHQHRTLTPTFYQSILDRLYCFVLLDVRTQAVIAAGARSLVVTGMLPLGCEPELLALFPGDADDYDRASGCITLFNDLAELHNRALNRMLRKVRRAHPGTTILYADLYRPIANLVASPGKYGACTAHTIDRVFSSS